MVVIHRAFGYRFVIYTQDHDRLTSMLIGEGEAKFDLLGSEGESRLVWSVGFHAATSGRSCRRLDFGVAEFLKAWERIHGR